jgi:hypothetical protein
MRKLSKWAKINPKSSRIIIGFSHLLVVINAFCLGVILFVFDYGESKWSSIIIANLFFISYLLYPRKDIKNERFRYSYTRQKILDFSLVIFYSVVIAFGVNSFLIQNNYDYNLYRQPTAEFTVIKPKSKNQTTTRKNLKSEVEVKIKKLRKQIKHELRGLKKELKRENDKGGVVALKILLTLLTIGVALLLGYLIAGLACSLACSGQGGLAWVVLVLGWGGMIWLGIIAIKNILSKIGKKKKASSIIKEN